MITVNAFLSSTLNTVDAVISNFVNTAYMNFIQANTGLITLLFTLYVMLLGYQFLFHVHHFNLNVVTRRLIVMLCVYGLVMNWNLYHLFVYNIFTNEPAEIINVLISSSGKFQSGGNIAQVLDGIYLSVINATTGFFHQVNFSAAGAVFIFYALLVFVIGTLMCVFALLLFIYAKMMMAIALALGPIFILFVLWESTKGLFSAWLNMLVTIALVPIITSAILVLMLSVISVTLPNINQSIDGLQFYGIAPFLGLSLATAMLLSQVISICSSLGGGLTLARLSTGAAIADAALEKSGIKAAGRWAANKFMHQKKMSYNARRK
ncbi:MAG: type IV secretion system protein [Gammaproteobacteria bacterium]|nr:type IV secretion system protein [Gammaproteobacteria bacterium]